MGKEIVRECPICKEPFTVSTPSSPHVLCRACAEPRSKGYDEIIAEIRKEIKENGRSKNN